MKHRKVAAARLSHFVELVLWSKLSELGNHPKYDYDL